MKYFNKTFFRFLFGFLSIIAFSSVLMYVVQNYGVETEIVVE